MGLLMTANVVSTWLTNARTKKDIKRIYKEATEANYVNRGVLVMPHLNKKQLLLTSGDSTDNDIYEYQTKSPTPAIDYIWGQSDKPESIIISGGKADMRVRTMMPFINKSQHEGIPVIAIHSGNRDLETLIKGNSVACELISSGNLYFDAFRALPVDDIAFLLYETIPDDDVKPCAEALMRSILEVLLRTDGKITFQNIAAFLSASLMDELNKLKASGEITSDEFNSISRDYMAGSSEIDAVRSFLNKLNRQAENVFGKPTPNICNIKKILNVKGIISFDTGIGNNELILTLLINQLIHLQSAGRYFNILIDGIAISRYSIICDFLRGRTYAISHNDFVSSLHGGERTADDLFAEITGDVNTVVLFTHKSGTSCQKWSEHLGKYHKIRIKMNISQTNSFIASGNTRGISVDEADEPRVRAETISTLPESLACIHNNSGTLFAEI